MSDETQVECPVCDGRGTFTDIIADGMGPELPCDECGGRGWIPRCPKCRDSQQRAEAAEAKHAALVAQLLDVLSEWRDAFNCDTRITYGDAAEVIDAALRGQVAQRAERKP